MSANLSVDVNVNEASSDHDRVLLAIAKCGGYVVASFEINGGGGVAGGKGPWRKNKPRHCAQCGELGHDKRTCPS